MSKLLKNCAIIISLAILTACGENSAASSLPLKPVEAADSAVTAEPTEENSTPLVTDSKTAATAQVVAPTFTATLTPQPTATGTPVPTATPAINTPTPTDAPEIILVDESAGVSVNVRSGPGTNYPVIGQLKPGEEAPVTGFNSDQTWWQIDLTDNGSAGNGWVYGDIVQFSGDVGDLAQAETPPTPIPPTPEAASPTPEAETAEAAETVPGDSTTQGKPGEAAAEAEEPLTPDELADKLRCGKDFCVTYQAMVPIWENGGCIGNHSIYVTVLEGPPPGRPLDGIVIGDTFGNVEVASGSKGPGTAEFTLWMNSMSVKVKRHIDGREFTSEESFSFTSHDELIPAEVLAASGYCDGSVEKCRVAQQQNQICRGHYSWRVTFHKFD